MWSNLKDEVLHIQLLHLEGHGGFLRDLLLSRHAYAFRPNTQNELEIEYGLCKQGPYLEIS